jgi:hypothetical protein
VAPAPVSGVVLDAGGEDATQAAQAYTITVNNPRVRATLGIADDDSAHFFFVKAYPTSTLARANPRAWS